MTIVGHLDEVIETISDPCHITPTGCASDNNSPCCRNTCTEYLSPKEIQEMRLLQARMSRQQQFILTSMHLSTGKHWKEVEFTILVSIFAVEFTNSEI